MKFISHRGNINGPNPDKENHPDYILATLKSGYDVEIDVWIIDKKIVLGHDKPQYEYLNLTKYKDNVFVDYLTIHYGYPSLWTHCKNFEALNKLPQYMNKFYHDHDDFTLTSQNFIWTYPNNLPLGKKSIAVMPEKVPGWDLSKAYGICSDYVEEYKKDLNFKL